MLSCQTPPLNLEPLGEFSPEEELKDTKTLKFCEMASNQRRCERFPARGDSYVMSTTCAKLSRDLFGKKRLEIPSSQGNLQSLHFFEKLNCLGDRNL